MEKKEAAETERIPLAELKVAGTKLEAPLNRIVGKSKVKAAEFSSSI